MVSSENYSVSVDIRISKILVLIADVNKIAKAMLKVVKTVYSIVNTINHNV